MDPIHPATERFDFLALFDDIVVSGEERVAKPAPEILEVLEKRVGHPVMHCVFVDDSAANVAAATEAGLDAILSATPDTSAVTSSTEGSHHEGADVQARLLIRQLPSDTPQELGGK